MNRVEVFQRIGRIIKAACPAGTAFAAVIDGHYMSSVERATVGLALFEWLGRRPRVALALSAVYAGPGAGESTSDFVRRQSLEIQCAAIAGAVSEVFVAAAKPITIAFFLFELGPPPCHMAYKIIGSEPLALGWITALAKPAKAN